MAVRSRTARASGSRRWKRCGAWRAIIAPWPPGLPIDDLAGPWGIEMFDEGLQWVEYATRLGLVDLWDVILGGAGHDAGARIRVPRASTRATTRRRGTARSSASPRCRWWASGASPILTRWCG